MNVTTYPVAAATPVLSADYLPFLLHKIDSSVSRIWASIFIIDARVDRDELLSVRTIIGKLAYAQWRGVDVRIVVGSAMIKSVYIACMTSAYYMKKRNLNVRGFGRSGKRKSTHSKYVLFDNDTSLIGSANWSHEALNGAVNTAVAVSSKELSGALATEFRAVWEASGDIVYDRQSTG